MCYTDVMTPLFSRILGKPRTKHCIAVDIGSNTAIRSLRFECDDSACIAAQKQYFELPQREQEADLIPPAIEYLRRLFFQYLKVIGRVPDEILMGLGNHFTFNEIVTERRARERPGEAIRPEELQEMLNDFMEAHREKVIGAKRFALAHLMPFRITADGYQLNALSRHSRGRIIEIALLATYAWSEYWEALVGLRSLLGGLQLTFISNQAAIAAALISVLNVRDALIVKIGAKITEVSLLGEGAMLWTGQFESGGDNFTTAVAERLKMDRRDAERLKRQWGQVSLPASSARRVQEALLAAGEQWLGKLVEFLKCDECSLLPERLYLLGGGARLEAVREALTSQPWYQDLTLLERLKVTRLDAEEFSGTLFRHTSPPLSGPEETALAAVVMRIGRHIGL